MKKETRKYADRREYLKMAVARRRKQIKLRAIAFKCGRCSKCGYDQSPSALDFHHVGKKEFGISANGQIAARSWELTVKELQNCILLCANCHRELHAFEKLQRQAETFD